MPVGATLFLSAVRETQFQREVSSATVLAMATMAQCHVKFKDFWRD